MPPPDRSAIGSGVAALGHSCWWLGFFPGESRARRQPWSLFRSLEVFLWIPLPHNLVPPDENLYP
jgi:hypothetical protein